MAIASIIRGGLVFLFLLATLGANMDDNLLARLGFEPSYTYVAGLSLLFSLLLLDRSVFVIVAVTVFSLNTNMPAEFSLNMGVDRDIYAGVMLALLFQPLMVRTLQIG